MPTDLFFRRRSIRSFTEETVTDEQLNYILKAGLYAPSAMNAQDWEFYVIKRGETLDKLAEAWATKALPKATNETEAKIRANREKTLTEASAAVVVCGNKDKRPAMFKDVEAYDGWLLNCSAAMENMLLAATELDLGGVWFGVRPFENRINAVKSVVELPEAHMPFSIFVVGVPKGTKNQEIERNITDKVHYVK